VYINKRRDKAVKGRGRKII